METMMATMWGQMGSFMATIMVLYTIWEKFIPPPLRDHLQSSTHKLTAFFSPYIHITFPELEGERLKRSDIFTAIQTYLTAHSSKDARRLKAESIKQSTTPILLTMDDNEQITDEFHGVKFWWTSKSTSPRTTSFSWYPVSDDRRFFKLTFHKKHREMVTTEYISHILKEGKEISSRNRQLKLYSNNPSNNWYGYKSTKWSNVTFEHPASFDTLALDSKLKEEIIKDLVKFKSGKNYYAKIGKAWKRGYLLFGPPGTGKSTMIAAMANFMNYDIYDLELTAVKDNAELRKLLLDTSPKSIVVIEDIDCSLDLTGQRKKKKKEKEEEEGSKDPMKKATEEEENKQSKVTLSGLLNVIDGIWSACGGERIFVFTTNFVDKLDPALIRRGRMDKHIELTYCCYEAFKLLARNCLDIESHDLYLRIEGLLGETKMTPADVAENLMPKSVDEDVDACLERLIEALEMAKKKAEEEEEAKKKRTEEEEAENKKTVEEKAEKNKTEEEKTEKKTVEEKEKENGEKSGEEVKENGFH